MSTWNLDTAHSEIGFKIRHLLISNVRGSFTSYQGTIESPDDSFEQATISFSADVASISTRNADRDQHLVSADFFDAQKFPTVTFQSTTIAKKGDTFDVTGDLTMHGVTKPVTFQATFNGFGTGFDGKRVAGFELAGAINRHDFGLTWNKTLDTGGLALGETVTFDIHVEAKQV